MPIVLGYTPTAEGEAALDRAVVEARAHGLEVLAVNVSASSDPPEETFADESEIRRVVRRLEEAGVTASVRQLVRGKDPAEEIVALAAESRAELVVIGLRHRSPVGKLLLGSNAQRILLDAPCPVLAVKVPR